MNFLRPPLLLLGAAAMAAPAFAQDVDEKAEPTSTVSSTRPATQATPSIASRASGSRSSQIVYINSAGHPKSIAPGTGGLAFTPGSSSSTAFMRPWFSADGSHWALEADIDSGSTTSDGVYIVDGNLFLREGDPVPWTAPAGETVGTLDDTIGINNAGELLVTNNTGGTAPSTADDYVVRFDASGVPTVLAKEGDVVDPVLTGEPTLAGATWDDYMDSPLLTDTGLAGWRAYGVDGTPGGTSDDYMCVLGNVLEAQEGDIPAGQAGGATDAWQIFDTYDYFVSPDGTNRLIQGDTDAASTDDDILVLNGTVVLQENQLVPGSSFTNPIDGSGIVKAWLDDAGNWYARGNNDSTEQDWVVRNGVLVAFSDGMDEIVAGSGEHWDDTDYSDCFYCFDGNDSGAFIIGGVTDAASDVNGVIVYDDGLGNRSVLVREGDPIDLDGNGSFDDDRYYNTFGNDDVILLDDGTVWFTATVRDGTGSAIEQGVFTITVGPPPASVTWRNAGGNHDVYTVSAPPVLGSTINASINATAAGHPFAQLFGYEGSLTLTIGPVKTILVDISGAEIFGFLAGSGPIVNYSLPVPSHPSLVGFGLSTQAAVFTVSAPPVFWQLTNAQDMVLGY